jgi:hypothetical protein
MRWTEPKIGETRERSAFLLVPKYIAREARWLERARWEETYQLLGFGLEWEPTRWIDAALAGEGKP